MQSKSKTNEVICVEPTTLRYREGVELGHCRDTADGLRHGVGVGAAWGLPAGEFSGRGDGVVWTGRLSRTGGSDGAVLADEAADAVLAVLPPKLGTGHGPCRPPLIQSVTEVTTERRKPMSALATSSLTTSSSLRFFLSFRVSLS